MTDLAFVVSPDGVVRMHDALICLAKFGEVVGLEAYSDKVSALYICIVLLDVPEL